jgi:hypothetical protein
MTKKIIKGEGFLDLIVETEPVKKGPLKLFENKIKAQENFQQLDFFPKLLKEQSNLLAKYFTDKGLPSPRERVVVTKDDQIIPLKEINADSKKNPQDSFKKVTNYHQLLKETQSFPKEVSIADQCIKLNQLSEEVARFIKTLNHAENYSLPPMNEIFAKILIAGYENGRFELDWQFGSKYKKYDNDQKTRKEASGKKSKELKEKRIIEMLTEMINLIESNPILRNDDDLDIAERAIKECIKRNKRLWSQGKYQAATYLEHCLPGGENQELIQLFEKYSKIKKTA